MQNHMQLVAKLTVHFSIRLTRYTNSQNKIKSLHPHEKFKLHFESQNKKYNYRVTLPSKRSKIPHVDCRYVLYLCFL